ncbi:zinc-dependent alcohol dehydrogenase family protein [Pectobacterium aroidearum]|uniref:zinc-dependent alcohol dehydrogenase family protein n=1 Tax=Pectobacterium aroidearum TaxID=1201031 RepID=UPI001CD35466|nr:zinc-dependent alcohol dehydrogenase family protein [Pectobacterium aroidearum]
MKAAVYDGNGKISWKEVKDATLEENTDALVKIIKTTICGSDLHILKGDMPYVPSGRVLGHEGIGIVEEIGDAVTQFKKGDKVVISAISYCGKCHHCKKGLYCHCESKDGGWVLGNSVNGTQAEYTRIPHADNSLIKVPENVDEESALMLSDILPTGFEVGVLAGEVKPGQKIAIIGAGPVGLSVLITSQFYSPAKIIMIDMDKSRLEMAKQLGATHTINPQSDDYASICKELTDGYGVDVAIECVGIPETFEMCQEIIAKGGRIANIGVHGKKVDLHMDKLWGSNIQITTGFVCTHSTPMLMESISSGKIDPKKLISHHFKLDEIEKAYQVFGNAAKEKAIKIILSK